MSASPCLVLYVTRAAFDLPDTSPFVLKTEVQLKMAGLDYERVQAIPPQSPTGKLPYLEDGGHVVADSTFIRAHLERVHGIDLDRGLDARRRAECWAIERMLEDHLYFAMVWFRWLDADNFARGPARFADAAPDPERMRRELQARKLEQMHAQGIGRHDRERIAELGGRSIDAFAVLLGERPYLGGDEPCGADATAFGMLAGVLTPFFDMPLRETAAHHANIVAYVARMMARYYPEHAWAAAA